jgi:hypothetical protein
MELNIINYILDTKKITQNELAEMLDPPVSKSILSKWKNGGETIPTKRSRELNKIARIGEFKKGGLAKWEDLTNNSEKIADEWYWNIGAFLPWENDCIWKDGDQFTKINYDSVWIDNIQRMLITLNDAGVPVGKLDVSFDPTREIKTYEEIIGSDGKPYGVPKEFVYTPADELIIPYIQAYLTLRSWANKFIININDKNLGKLQFDLALIATRIALLHIPREKFDAVGTDLEVLDKYNEETKKEAFQLITEFCNVITNKGDTLFVDYFKYLNADKKSLDNDIGEKPKTETSDDDFDTLFFTEAETKIYEGIKNNEILLKEILEKLNK